MKMLAGNSFIDEIIKNLWMRRLPQHINIALLSVGDKTLNELSALADKIYGASQSANKYSVSAPQVLSPPSSNRDFEDHLARIESKIETISFRSRTRSRQRQNIRNNRSHSRTNSRSSAGICWYHRSYKSNARKCERPCNFGKVKFQTPTENPN